MCACNLGFRFVTIGLMALLVSGCRAPDQSADDNQSSTSTIDQQPVTATTMNLLGPDHIGQWQPAQFGGQGDFLVDDNKVELDFGYQMTGVTYRGEIPQDQYEIRYEARRLDGLDFFATLTFPVRQSHCSLVLGGWGGGLVGLSCIDGEDASQNETKSIFGFQQEQWYQIRVRVVWPNIQCWIDDQQVVDVDVRDRQLDVRSDVRVCIPLGLCSYETRGEIRNMRLVDLSESTK